jgi:DNA-binding NarL/FixJ family response regulator
MIRRMHASTDAATPAETGSPVSRPGSRAASLPDGSPVRVLVVDADRRVRAAMASLIALAGGLELVGSVAHVAGAVEALETAPVDVVVIDPKLPDVDAGIGLVEHIRRHWPAIGVIVLAWSDPDGAGSLPMGADRYLSKTVAPGDLIDALEAFDRGRSARAPRPGRAVDSGRQPEEGPP